MLLIKAFHFFVAIVDPFFLISSFSFRGSLLRLCCSSISLLFILLFLLRRSFLFPSMINLSDFQGSFSLFLLQLQMTSFPYLTGKLLSFLLQLQIIFFPSLISKFSIALGESFSLFLLQLQMPFPPFFIALRESFYIFYCNSRSFFPLH